MRPALLAALAPLAIAGLFLVETVSGSAYEVRYAWVDWVPATLALLGTLGPSLLARGTLSRVAARGVVLAALAGLLVHAVLIIFVPTQPVEVANARMWPLLDVLASAAFVAVAALGVKRPWPVVTWLLAAGLLGRAAFNISTNPVPRVIAGALLWASAVMLAAALAAARFRLPPAIAARKRR